MAVEQAVAAPLPGGAVVAGRVDRIDRIRIPDPDKVDPATGEIPIDPATGQLHESCSIEGLRVTDFKTGKCRVDDPSDLAHDRGAQVYALATTRTFRQPVLEVRFLYLMEDRAVTWSVEREDLVAIQKRLVEDLNQLSDTSEFEARPDYYCDWCQYRELCPAAGQSSLEQLDSNPQTVF